MIELGKIQTLAVIRQTPNGVYLNAKEAPDGDDILLPKNQVTPEMALGTEVEVFVYKDSEDRIIATVKRPKLTMGELARLSVVETTPIGAFLDWGLEKDLLLPFREQRGTVNQNDTVLVGLYIDKSTRLCATMKIANLLNGAAPYKPNQRVRGVIYRINPALGAFVAVENQYHGLILNKEFYGQLKEGDSVEARIKKVREDGKLELSLRENSTQAIESDAQTIMDRLADAGGKLAVNDNSDPEQIKAELQMSKAAFKRAVGRLLKEGAIQITEQGIERTW